MYIKTMHRFFTLFIWLYFDLLQTVIKHSYLRPSICLLGHQRGIATFHFYMLKLCHQWKCSVEIIHGTC